MSNFNKKITFITEQLKDLPGEEAHTDMIPFRLKTSEALKKPVDYKLSAVLLLLYKTQNSIEFILTERQTYKGKHSGQISFPGGKAEPFDKGTHQTALRETKEELGIDTSNIQLIGQLTQVYIPVSNFLIHPYVGYIDELPNLTPDPREVRKVLHVPVDDLINENKRIETDIDVGDGRIIKQIPAFHFSDRIVWGATAIMLNEFKLILKRED